MHAAQLKAAMLGVIVHLLTAPGIELPRPAQELLYGALTAPNCNIQAFCCMLPS